jgi:glycosyltransferase involved in cell wall biosynthesis
MRIDLVITELDMGGAERCCAELSAFLSKRNHRVRVIALGPSPVAPKDGLVQLLKSESIELIFLGGTRASHFPRVAWKLRALLRSDPPDIVQSFLWHGNVLSAAIVPSFRIPLVGGVRVAEPRRNRHFLGRWAASRMHRVVCVSQSISDWCVKTEGVNQEKLVVIPNGVSLKSDDTAIAPRSHSVPENSRILLFVGRLELQKGIDILIEHAAGLLRQLPKHHLVMIGDGAWRQATQALAQRNELDGRVHCLGQRRDVRSWMARSELLLLPTRYEGMPNVILEAMAESLALVTTRVEGIAELLGDHFHEQTVRCGDWAAFFKQIALLAENGSLRQTLGQANRKRVESHFNLENQLRNYELLYEEILSKSDT